jgi:alpha-1,6-mannosyltransferase
VFARTWRANDLLFGLLDGDGSEAALLRAKLAAAGITVAVWTAMVVRRRDAVSVYGWTVGAALLLSPVIHPWYVIWLLPAVVLGGQMAWWAWSVTVFLAYAPLPGFLARGAWEERLWIKTLEMAPVLVLLPVQLVLEGTRRPAISRPGRPVPRGGPPAT